MVLNRSLPFAFLVTAMLACSGGGGSETPAATPDPDEGKTASKPLKAAEGGTLATESGKASVTVPPGALAADTTLTVTVSKAEGEAKTSLYDFGPNGTQFAKPVAITVAFDSTVASGKKAVLAWHDGSKWVEVEGSALAGGKVTGSVSHFTKFTVILKDDKVVVVSECGDTAKNFKACGGDIAGTWKYENLCFADTVIGENPFKETCPSATMTMDMKWEGSVTFADGKMTSHFVSQGQTVSLNVPKSCFASMPGTDCAKLAESMKTECKDTGTACECVKTTTNTDIEDETKDYSIDGNTLVSKGSDGKESRNDYCVSGGKLVAKVVIDEDGKTMEMFVVLKK
jgi:hypothetical protein